MCAAAGAGLLMLPMATRQAITTSDALFTALSAITVTGLTVVPTGATFTFFGQAVILALIQIGGLGLMVLAVVILSMLGMRIGVVEKSFLTSDLGISSRNSIFRVTWLIFRVVLVCELAGAALLAIHFVPSYGLVDGLWHSVFHAVSAFNNAGFALFENSLAHLFNDIFALLVIIALLTIGGLGFAVLSDLIELRRWRRFSLHTKIMLVGSLLLVSVSLVLFVMLEWQNPSTLGLFESPLTKLQVALFEVTSPRTAGFNIVETQLLEDSTTLLTVVLMIIGGGSTSTAGGIKVTTFFVLLLATIAFLRRSKSIRAFGYQIGILQGLKVMALLTISVLLMIGALFTLLMTQPLPFLDLLFEVASAFGTVGLSRGATEDLDNIGRAIICGLMVAGRLGPLFLGYSMARQSRPLIRYPEGQIYLG